MTKTNIYMINFCHLIFVIDKLAALPRRGGVAAVAATATLHIEHSIRGLNPNVAILLNMQSMLRRRGIAASI